MGKRKDYTKDELKGFLTILKDITGVKYDTRNLSSKENCKIAMTEIIQETIKNKYSILYSENIFLKAQIKELNEENKKEINFYKEAIKYFNDGQEDYRIEAEYSKNKQIMGYVKHKKANKKWWKFWE